MRLLSAGARVFKWGVPRVWLADMDFPVRRCACTLRVMCGRLVWGLALVSAGAVGVCGGGDAASVC
jgi:hypothetical protein